jgi:hypothetical protein
MASPVAAQNGSDGPGIELNESVTLSEPDSERTYAQEIDSGTRLVSWDYNDSREGFVLTFETNSSRRITLTEAVQFSEGAGSGRIYQQRLPEGVSQIFVSVPRRGGQAAVTMVTRQSTRENRFTYVSTGEAQVDRPPITFERVQAIVGLTALGSAGLVFGIIKRRRESEERDYERIL